MTDDARLPDPLAAARLLPKGSVVILRARAPKRRAALARSLSPLAKARGLIFLVADDPGLAAKIGAHGLHLPQKRAREAGHWRVRFPGWLITASAHDLASLLKASHADAVLLSPVFATRSHQQARPLGPARARLLARQMPFPVFALGGIDARNAAQLAGFAGLAALGGLSAQDAV